MAHAGRKAAADAAGGPRGWDPKMDAQHVVLVRSLVCAEPGSPAQPAAWGALFTALAPWLQRWCQQSRLLRRAGLTNEDHWRAVLLRAVERMVRREYKNLRDFVAQVELRSAAGTLGPTPLEAWLRQLIRYAAADELTRRLAVKRVLPAGGAGTVEDLGGGPAPETRSAASLLDARHRSVAIQQAIADLNEDQVCALVGRVEGSSFCEIAASMEIDEDRARALVRSAKARLRRSLRQSDDNGAKDDSG